MYRCPAWQLVVVVVFWLRSNKDDNRLSIKLTSDGWQFVTTCTEWFICMPFRGAFASAVREAICCWASATTFTELSIMTVSYWSSYCCLLVFMHCFCCRWFWFSSKIDLFDWYERERELSKIKWPSWWHMPSQVSLTLSSHARGFYRI